MFSGISQLYLQLIPAYIKFGICIFWLLLSCLSLSFIKLEIKVMWPLALFLLYITVIYVFSIMIKSRVRIYINVFI